MDASMLARVVETVHNELKLFEEQQEKGKGNVILLVGNTGSGKSTLFNFLIGGTFKVENDILTLQNKKEEQQYSRMTEGKSETKVPKCYYDKEQQHLIVDFPGFGDTNGSEDEIVIQSLFNKITSKYNLKIVYVSSQSTNLLRDRAKDTQDFLKQLRPKPNDKITVQEDKITVDKITLLMNLYCHSMKEETVILKWQQQIKEALLLDQYQGKIILQRQISETGEIEQYFSSQQREKIWKELVQTPVVTLQPYQFKDRDYITSYLIERINLILFETFEELHSQLLKLTFTIEQLEKVIQLYLCIQELLKLAAIDTIMSLIDEYLSIMNEIRTILTLQSKLNYDKEIFKLIYIFFLDFQDQIDGYKQVGQTICQVTKNYNLIIKMLNKQKEDLITIQETEKKRAEEEKLKQQAEEREKQRAAEVQELEKKRAEEEKLKQQAQEREKQRAAEAQESEKKRLQQAEEAKKALAAEQQREKGKRERRERGKGQMRERRQRGDREARERCEKCERGEREAGEKCERGEREAREKCERGDREARERCERGERGERGEREEREAREREAEKRRQAREIAAREREQEKMHPEKLQPQKEKERQDREKQEGVNQEQEILKVLEDNKDTVVFLTKAYAVGVIASQIYKMFHK